MTTLGTGQLGSGTLGNPSAGAAPPPPQRAVDLRVEIDSREPGHAWTAVTGWTRIDATNALRSVHIRRGLPVEDANVADPGEAVLVFDNRNGYLDRGYTASPYAALLTPGRQLRITWVKADASVATLFHGTVDDWPMTIIGDGFDAAVELLVTDILGHLGAALTPSSLVEYELKKGSKYPRPTALYPTNETTTAQDVEVADVIGDFSGLPVGSPEAASGSQLVPYSAVEGVRNKRGSYVQLPAGILAAKTFDWSLMVIYTVDEDGFGFFFRDAQTISGVSVSVNGTGGARPVKVEFFDAANVKLGEIATTINYDDGVPHIVGLAFEAAANRFYLYVDNVSTGAIEFQSLVPGDWKYDATQPWRALSGGDKAAGGFIGVWNGRRLQSTEWTNIWTDIRRPWQGHTTDQRINAVLDLVAPGCPRSIVASSFPFLPVTLAENPALDVLRRTVEGADGTLWGDRTNQVRFNVRPVGEPPAALRTYGTGGVPVVEALPTSPPLVTECVVTSEAGAVQSFEDTAASQSLGHHRHEMDDIPLAVLDHLYLLAERRVHYGSRRRPHIGTFKVRPVDPLVGFDNTLSLDLFDRIAVAYDRSWAGVVTEQAEVIGIEHDASDAGFFDWTTTVRVRPPRTRRLRLTIPTTGLGASTPDSVANSITGDIDLRSWAARDDWMATTGIIIAKGDFTTVASSYSLYVLTGGRLEFAWQTAAGGTQVLAARLPRGGSRFIWVRGTLVVATGLARLWISEDGADWRIIGERTAGATDIRDTANPLEIGRRTKSDGTTELPLVGSVFYAEGRAGIDGTVRWRFDPTTDASAAGATSWAASTGETWTVRSGSAIAAW